MSNWWDSFEGVSTDEQSSGASWFDQYESVEESNWADQFKSAEPASKPSPVDRIISPEEMIDPEAALVIGSRDDIAPVAKKPTTQPYQDTRPIRDKFELYGALDDAIAAGATDRQVNDALARNGLNPQEFRAWYEEKLGIAPTESQYPEPTRVREAAQPVPVETTGEIKPLTQPKPTIPSIQAGIRDSFATGLQDAASGARILMSDLFGDTETMKQSSRDIQQRQLETALLTPDFKSETGQGVYGGLTSLAHNVPPLILGFTTGNPELALLSMVGPQGLAKYGEYRAEGIAPMQALVSSVGYSAVEYFTEKLPMGQLFRDFGKVGFGKMLMNNLARELPGEQVATLLQDAIDQANLHPEMTLQDYLAARPGAAYQTLVATFVQSGLLSSAGAIINKVRGLPSYAGQEGADTGNLNIDPTQPRSLFSPAATAADLTTEYRRAINEPSANSAPTVIQSEETESAGLTPLVVPADSTPVLSNPPQVDPLMSALDSAVDLATGVPAAQQSEQPDVNAEPTVPLDDSVLGTPESLWLGRKGNGYTTEADARQAIAGRQRANPGLTWKIEQMPDGMFRLAGYRVEPTLKGTNASTEPTQAGSTQPSFRPTAVGATQTGSLGVTSTPVATGYTSVPDTGISQRVSIAQTPAATRANPAQATAVLRSLNAHPEVKAEGGVRVARSSTQVEAGLPNFLSEVFNRPVVWVESARGVSAPLFFNGVTPDRNTILIDVNSKTAPVLTFMHEGVHTMPEPIRKRFIAAVRDTLQNRDKFAEAFGYDQNDPLFEEEMVAKISEGEVYRPSFLKELKRRLGNKDFQAVIEHLITSIDRLLTGYNKPNYSKYTSDIKKFRSELANAYAQTLQETGDAQAAARFVNGQDLTNEEQSQIQQELQDELNDPQVPFSRKRQDDPGHRMNVTRNERVRGDGTLSEQEEAAIARDAERLGVSVADALAKAQADKARFPEIDGWSPLQAIGIEKVKAGKNGNATITIKYLAQKYSYNKPPGTTRAPQSHDAQWARQLANLLVSEVRAVYERAAAGDQAAKVIVRQAGWYRNMAARLRAEFGAAGDFFSDLLGATSPNTPVATNWRFAVDIIRQFSNGAFRREMQAFADWVESDRNLQDFPDADKIRQISGKLYGMNSVNSMKAILSIWRSTQPGQAPKARNFAMNLIGASDMATIDVWAARMLQRIANTIAPGSYMRIPTLAEVGVDGVWNASGTQVTGAYGFGAQALDIASHDLRAMGIDLSAPDLQAVAWFMEKALWTERNWTSVSGEGGSFEEQADKDGFTRYLAGISIQQGEVEPSDAQMLASQARIMRVAQADNAVVVARAEPTVGLYADTVERSFDVELTVTREFDPTAMVSELAKLAKENEQLDMFVSRVLQPGETSDNARPGVEVYFKPGSTRSDIDPVLNRLRALEVDGFTLAVDPRVTLAPESGKTPQKFVAIRVQYVPEIDMRWNEEARTILGSGDESSIRQWLDAKRSSLNRAVVAAKRFNAVEYAARFEYDTIVIGKENYADYTTNADTTTGTRDQGSQGRVWFGRAIGEGLRAAARRLEGNRGPESVSGLPDGRDGAGQGPIFSRAAGSAEPAGRPGASGNARAGGVVQAPRSWSKRPPRPEAASVSAWHYGTSKVPFLSGSSYGRGIKGAERERVMSSRDPRIQRRVYFYIPKDDGSLPAKEQGLGPHRYEVQLQNMYDPAIGDSRIPRAADGMNAFESSVLDAGYDGYIATRLGMAVVLDADVSATYVGTPAQQISEPAPQASLKKSLLSREIPAAEQIAAQIPGVRVRNGSIEILPGQKDVVNDALAAADIGIRFSRAQIETPEFKRWFGNSVIVNADGTPKLMYHGTARDISVFKAKQAKAIFVTDDPEFAESFANLSLDFINQETINKLTRIQKNFVAKEVTKNIRSTYSNKKILAEMLGELKSWQADSANKLGGEVRDLAYEAMRQFVDGAQNIAPLYVRAENPFDYANKDHTDRVLAEVGQVPLRGFGNPKQIVTGNWGIIESPRVQAAIRKLGFDGFYIDEDGHKNLAVYEPNQLKSAVGNNGQFSLQNNNIAFSRAQTNTPEFKQWFGDSKVVDENGDPLVLYHGTRNNFDYFSESRNEVGSDESGFYLTTNSDHAGIYTDEPGGNIMPVYLRADNLYEVSDADWQRGKGLSPKQAREQGYDGYIVRGMEGGDTYVAFRPEQIKSAIGNRGTFDGANPDIRFSRQRSRLNFYSALAEGVDGIKSSAAPANGWKDAIKGLVNKGLVKADEVEWSGVNDWLDLQQGKVTKQQVTDYLKQGGVQVTETVLGGSGPVDALNEVLPEDLYAERKEDGEVVYFDESGAEFQYYELSDEVRGLIDKYEPDYKEAKFQNYSLPGGENYREVLLRLPEKKIYTSYFYIFDTRTSQNSRVLAGKYSTQEEAKKAIRAYAEEDGLSIDKVLKHLEVRRFEKMLSGGDLPYQSPHWDQKNVLAHIRVNDRTDADGQKVLFVEEIQSDWGQDGKKKGFNPAKKTPPKLVINEIGAGFEVYNESLGRTAQDEDGNDAIFENRRDAEAMREQLLRDPYEGASGVPAAPFVTKTEGWLNLALKRILSMAVQGGYDKVAFVNGEQSAERYDLSKQVDKITIGKVPEELGAWQVVARKGGEVAIDKFVKDDSELAALIGKDLAEKAVAKNGGSFSGLDLKIGGEGMKIFYDQIVPAAVNKLVKKLGGQAGMVEIVGGNSKFNSFGERVTRDGEQIKGNFKVTYPGTEYADDWFDTLAEANEQAANNPGAVVVAADVVTQPGITITDQMREKVRDGLPLFSRNQQTPPPGGVSTSGWRDEIGRLQFMPGAYVYNKGANLLKPILTKLGLQAAPAPYRKALRSMQAQVWKAQEVTTAVAKEMIKLSESERNMVSDYIEGELQAGVMPPQAIVDIAIKISAAMEAQTNELVRLGMLSQETADRWRGRYLPRFYDSKLRRQKNQPWVQAVLDTLRPQRTLPGIKGSSLRGRGLYDVVLAQEIPAYEAQGWEVRDPDYVPGQSSVAKMWRDYTRDERDSMGEIRDGAFRFVMGYNASQRDIALGRLFERIADEYGSTGMEPGYVQVPKTEIPETGVWRYGKLAGMWIPEEIFSQLKDFDNAGTHDELVRAYKAALALWKEGKTALNPVSHFNNIVSNVTMAQFAGVSYWDAHKYALAAKELLTDDPMVQEAKDAGLFTGTVSKEEMLQMLPEPLRVLAQKEKSRIRKTAEGTLNVMTLFLRRPMGKLYQNEDLFFRYLLYREARNAGTSPEDSVDYAGRYIFTYDDLPSGARRIRDMALPFFSYTYKAIPVLIKTALTHPGRMAMPAALLYTLNAAMYAVAYGDEDEDWQERILKYVMDEERRKRVDADQKRERELLPPWLKGTSALMTPKAVRLGVDSVTNLPMFLDVSRLFPGGDLLDVQSNTGGVAWLQNFTPSNPLITTFAALFANRDMWTGKDLLDKTDSTKEKAQKVGEWAYRQFAPAIAVGNYHWDRIMNAIAHQADTTIPGVFRDYTGTDKQGNPQQLGLTILNTFGIKARPYDLDLTEQIDDSKTKGLIRELKIQEAKLKRLYSNNAISDREFDLRMTSIQEKVDNLKGGLDVNGNPKE